ncbi:MAG TPA: hypothetical protein VM534_06290 [Thermoanaerobaculia bacterium]|nr:hypothetical protein [Thermoanaerobaculia bacterium]
MADFQHVINEIVRRYRGEHELHPERIGMILYLIDWRSAIERGNVLTDVNWVVSDYGPEARDRTGHSLTAITQAPPDFSSLAGEVPPGQGLLSDQEGRIVEFVLDSVSDRSDAELAQLVFSTFPMVMTQRPQTPLDLVSLAENYNQNYRNQLLTAASR